MTNTTILAGKNDIMKYLGRSWRTILNWVENPDAPIAKIDGRWESDAEALASWRKDYILSQRPQKKSKAGEGNK